VNVPLQHSQRNWGARIRDLTYQGLRLIVLENETLRIGTLPGKGTDVVELNYKPRDLDFVWLAPGGIRNPTSYLSTSPDPLAAYLDYYPGGWQEVFPSGGAPSEYAGARFGQHGEVFALPWAVTVVEDTQDEVAVTFDVRAQKVPCAISKTIRLASVATGFSLEERLVNESPVNVRATWGHHIAFGPPFLRPGCRIRLPDGLSAMPHPDATAPGGRRVANIEPFTWPEGPGSDGGVVDFSRVPERGARSDLFYLHGFRDGRGWYEVLDEDRGIGCRIEWDARAMPYLWYWQEFGATTGYPWYGRNFNIGLEPFSSYPTNGIAEAVANGTALQLEPGSENTFWLSMSVVDER
jgi:hypothetical protein